VIDLSPVLDPHFTLHMLHVFGAITAIGAVLMTDAVNGYMHLKPSNAKYNAMMAPIFSLIIWVGFLILSITGLLMFLMHPNLALERSFQVKMFIVVIVFLNGVFLNIWVTPKFQELAPEWENRTEKVKTFEKVAGLAAVVSVIGWISLFFLGYLIANA